MVRYICELIVCALQTINRKIKLCVFQTTDSLNEHTQVKRH